MLVDTHAHLLPYDYPDDAPECFPRMEPVDGETARTLLFGAMRFKAKDVFFDAERRVEAQHASGVDAEVISPMPPLLRYDLPPAEGMSLARYVNEFTATMCVHHPSRMLGLGTVPLQAPEAAAGELTAIKDMGLLGVEIASNIAGESIGDERFQPFFAEAERLGAAVFVHAMPTATERLPAAAMGTYVVGLEGAMAAASMVVGGTAGKCPDLRLAFSHAAGGYPFMLPRAQYFWGGSWNEEPVDLERAVAPDDGPSPLEHARRFYYDSLVFDHRAVRYLLGLIGPDRLLIGSDFPAMPREDPAGRTVLSMGLDEDTIQRITWGNAFDWLGIEAPR